MTTKTSKSQKSDTINPASGPETQGVPMFDKGDLGKVQELLYGAQMTRIVQQIEQMGQQFSSRLQAIETSLRDGLKALATVQESETAERQTALQALQQECEQADTALHKGMDKLQRDTAKADTALAESLENAASHWMSTLDLTREDLLDKLIESTAQLKAQKVDRSALSGLLGGLAQQIDTVVAAPEAQPQTPEAANG
ncbi:MAG: hypothetical protein ACR2P1_26780 [Pseudomonadales bacterium]